MGVAFDKISRRLDRRFTEHTECRICLEDFKSGDNVSPLPCNKRHYFHTSCIKDWTKYKLYCPLCNLAFTPK